jgi:hypothetical protein
MENNISLRNLVKALELELKTNPDAIIEREGLWTFHMKGMTDEFFEHLCALEGEDFANEEALKKEVSKVQYGNVPGFWG